MIAGYAGEPDECVPPGDVGNNEDKEFFMKHKMRSVLPDVNRVQLFNVVQDPSESVDLAEDNPDLVLDLMDRIRAHLDTMIEPDVAEEIIEGNPSNFGGAFDKGWCESRP